MLFCALYTVLIKFFCHKYVQPSLWKRLNLDSSDHKTFFNTSCVQSLWSFAHWRHCYLCLGSNSGFHLNRLLFNPAYISHVFAVLGKAMSLFSSIHIFFIRGVVSLLSLTDFYTRLLLFCIEDNLGDPGCGFII